MNEKTMLALLSVLAIGMTAPAYADTPLQQWDNGVPIEQIQCKEGKILMQSPNGKPACLSENSAERLVDRGFIVLETNEIITITSSSPSGGFGGQRGPSTSMTIQFPSTVTIGDEFTINYAIDVSHIDDVEDILNESFGLGFGIWLPSEFSTITDYTKTSTIAVDQYHKHAWQRYRYDLSLDPSNDDVITGQLRLKLDEPMIHEFDKIILMAGFNDHPEIKVEKTSTGIKLSKAEPDFYVVSMDNNDGRYNAIFDIDTFNLDEYVPKRQPQSGATGNTDYPHIDYVPNTPGVWEGFAEYLRWNQNEFGVRDFEDFLLNHINMSQRFVDDYFEAYPEFRTQSHSSGATGATSFPTSLFVSGTLQTQLRNSIISPVNDVKVCLFDKNLTTNQFDLLYFDSQKRNPSCELINDDGTFTLQAISDDPDDSSPPDVNIGILFENDIVYATGPDNDIPSRFNSDRTYEDYSETVLADVRQTLVFNTNQQHSYYHILDITDASEKTSNEANYDPPRVRVLFSVPSLPFYCHSNECSQGSNIIIIGLITEYGGEQLIDKTPTVILHEYGHHVQSNLYQNLNSDIPDCGDHSLEQVSSLGCQWSEGFAWFYTLWVLDDPDVNTSFSIDPVNFETGHYTVNEDYDTPFPFSTTNDQKSEGWVASTLWDIYDTTNEQDDDISNGGSDIWRVIRNSASQSIFEFETAWNNNNQPSLNSIFDLNNIREYTPPPSITRDNPTNAYYDEFDDLDKWILSGTDWELSDPEGNVPGESGRNMVAHSENCNDECIMLLNPSLNTQRELEITFYRYVADNADNDEGLYVQYSVRDGVWETLASYTEDNDQDTGEWEFTRLSLNVREDMADLRFLAKSTSGSEKVEIDNLRIVTKSDGGGSNPTPPTITNIPTDISLISDGDSVPATFTIPTTNKGTISCDYSSGDLFPVGVTTVTCTATSGSLSASATFDVVVTLSFDDTPPTLTIPEDKTFEATGPLTVLTVSQIGTASATDNSGEPTLENDIPESFPVGMTEITYTATDGAGNSVTDIQRITITDTTAPIFTSTPEDITITTNDESGIIITFDYPTVIDLVDQDVTISSTHESGSLFAVGTTTVTFTGTDDAGLTVTHDLSIRVNYTSQPVLPDTVQNLQIDFTHNSVTATWDDDFDEYEVRLFKIGNYKPGVTITENSYTGTILPDTRYRLVVVPDNTENIKAAIEFRSLYDPDHPIQNLQIIPRHDSLNLSWDNDAALNYTITVKEDQSLVFEETTISSMITAPDLNFGKRHTVTVMVTDIPSSIQTRHVVTMPADLSANPVSDGFENLSGWSLAKGVSPIVRNTFNNYTLSLHVDEDTGESSALLHGGGFGAYANIVRHVHYSPSFDKSDGPVIVQFDYMVPFSSYRFVNTLYEDRVGWILGESLPIRKSGTWQTYTKNISDIIYDGPLRIQFGMYEESRRTVADQMYIDNFRMIQRTSDGASAFSETTSFGIITNHNPLEPIEMSVDSTKHLSIDTDGSGTALYTIESSTMPQGATSIESSSDGNIIIIDSQGVALGEYGFVLTARHGEQSQSIEYAIVVS